MHVLYQTGLADAVPRCISNEINLIREAGVIGELLACLTVDLAQQVKFTKVFAASPEKLGNPIH